jgi:hypothetical protein
MATLTDHVKTQLITAGIGRNPRTAGSLPPVWRQPAAGTPAPGEGANAIEIGPDAVIGLVYSGGIATPRLESAWRRDIVDIWLRTSTWPRTTQLYAQIRAALIDRTNWTMGTITVIESQEWRPLQPLENDVAQGYTSQAAVLFQTYAADHF